MKQKSVVKVCAYLASYILSKLSGQLNHFLRLIYHMYE